MGCDVPRTLPSASSSDRCVCASDSSADESGSSRVEPAISDAWFNTLRMSLSFFLTGRQGMSDCMGARQRGMVCGRAYGVRSVMPSDRLMDDKAPALYSGVQVQWEGR